MTEEHYSIGEFASMTGLSTYTLRYYEQENLIVPQRDENNRRYYTILDLKWIGFLLHLKGTGMTMDQIEDYVELRKQGDQTIDERIHLLKSVQKDSLKKIDEMQKNLKVLNDKVNWYEGKKNRTINDDFETYQNKINQGAQKMNEELKNGNIFGFGEPNKAYADFFKGNSFLKTLVADDDIDVGVGNVTFEPGCRNNWHVHYDYQILLVTGGRGWYQEANKNARELVPGDVVVTKSNVKHWHGASKDSWFEHIAITKGKSKFLEPVSDEEYDRLGE